MQSVALQPCDVLSLVGTVNYWKDYRGQRMQRFLADHQVDLEFSSLKDPAEICDAIRRTGCRVFFNEAWHIDPLVFRDIAPVFPEVQFINMNHSSLVLTGIHEKFVGWFNRNHRHSIEMAREHPNVWYGTPMDLDHLPVPDGTNVITIPNIVPWEQNLSRVRQLDRSTPLRIGLIGRPTTAKNWLAHVSAIAEIATVTEVNVILGTNSSVESLSDYTKMLDLFEVPWTFVGWQGHDKYLSMLANNVDLLLHASLCESFGLVPLEAMMVGRPVVGSFAIEFLPDQWKANPQNPGDIADKAFGILRDYEFQSRLGIATSASVVGQNEHKYLINLDRLL